MGLISHGDWMQDARCIATTVDPVMAQLKALAPLNILFSWVRIPSLSGILSSSKKLGTGKADLPALSEALSDKQYKQSIKYDAPNETLASEIQLPNEVPSDPIRSHQQSLVQLPGRKNSLPSCTPAMGTSLDKGVINCAVDLPSQIQRFFGGL